MVASRRIHDNFALDHARSLAAKFKRPVLVFEPLRHGYRHASDRLHSFVLDGMVANASACQALGLRYYPFVERADVPGKGLLAALAEHACAVVTDDFPDFFLPRMIHAASAQVRVKRTWSTQTGCSRFAPAGVCLARLHRQCDNGSLRARTVRQSLLLVTQLKPGTCSRG